MTTPHGERVGKALALTSRERRRLVSQLLAAQEVADKAQEALERVMIEVYDKGLSYANVGGALGIHPTSAQGRIQRARAEQDGS